MPHACRIGTVADKFGLPPRGPVRPRYHPPGSPVPRSTQRLKGLEGAACDLCRRLRHCRADRQQDRLSRPRPGSGSGIQGAWGALGGRGEITSFPQAVKSRPDETVCFSWILWPSRDVRNEAMPKIMSDPRMDPTSVPMPFDGKRMIYGRFEVLVDA